MKKILSTLIISAISVACGTSSTMTQQEACEQVEKLQSRIESLEARISDMPSAIQDLSYGSGNNNYKQKQKLDAELLEARRQKEEVEEYCYVANLDG